MTSLEAPRELLSLEHVATCYDEFVNDPVVYLECSTAMTVLLTKAGRMFWIGVLPLFLRVKALQDYEQKWAKFFQENTQIPYKNVGDKVR